MLCTLFSVGATDYFVKGDIAGLSQFWDFSTSTTIGKLSGSGTTLSCNVIMQAASTSDNWCYWRIYDSDGKNYGFSANTEATSGIFIYDKQGCAKTAPGVYTVTYNTETKAFTATQTSVQYAIDSWANGAFTSYYAQPLTSLSTNYYCYNFPTAVTISETEGTNGFLIAYGGSFIQCYGTNHLATNQWNEGYLNGTDNVSNATLNAGTYYRLYLKLNENTSDANYYRILASTIPTTGLDISSNASASVSGQTVTLSATEPSTISDGNGSVTSWVVTENGTQVASSATSALPSTALNNVEGGTHNYVFTLTYKDAAGVESFTATATKTVTVVAPSAFTSAAATSKVGKCVEKMSETSSKYKNRYRITFPATSLQWTANIPTGATKYDYAITFYNASDASLGSVSANDITDAQKTVIVYGVYGAAKATITCTYKDDASTTIGSGSTTVSPVNISAPTNGIKSITGTGKLFTAYAGGSLIGEITGVDSNDDAAKASWYEVKRHDGTKTAVFSDYNVSTTPFSAEIQSPTVKNETPAIFHDIISTGRGSGSITQAEAEKSYSYIIVPHFFMVSLPILETNIGQYIDNDGKLLSTTSGSGAAPALTLENISKNRIKNTAGTALLGSHVTDVPVEAINDGNEGYSNVQITYAQGTVPTGIEGVTVANVSIIGGEGMITVNGANNVAIYDTTGRLITKVAGQNQIDMPAGLYIVRADSKVAKVVVK